MEQFAASGTSDTFIEAARFVPRTEFRMDATMCSRWTCEILTKRQSVPSNVDRGTNAHETGLQRSCGAAEKEPWHKVALT
jgi:transcriptional regulator of nitric oxide reductase